ncbi:MAG TPA: hypothetical protein DCM08_07830 [Microscillaceae bacterium]|jgi:hypothetical protein|nr:hypothetical protein [Microscillaceae bacterium]
MDTENLLYLTDDPSRITESDYFALEDIAKEYPYFQLAHILVAKGAQKTITANVKLRKAAAYAPDRNLLRKLLYAGNESFNPTISIVPEQPANLTEPVAIEKVAEPPFSTEATLSIVENSDLSWLDAEEPTETLAVSLLKKGQKREAIYIYERLIDKKPQRRDYYVRQVRILTDNQTYDYKPGSEVELVSDLHKGISEEKNAADPAPVETVSNELDVNILAAQNPELTALQNVDISDDKISETYALILFSKSKFFESLLVYHKLLAKYPEREDYYKLQIKEIELKIKQLQLQPSQPETTALVTEPSIVQAEEMIAEADLPTESTEKPEIHPSILPTQDTYVAQATPPAEEASASFFDQILPPDEELESYTIANASTEKAQDPSQILHSGIETEEINEAEALKAFQQGNIEDALAIYKKLALRFPDKEAYYLSQIDILRGNFKPEDQFPSSHTSEELSDASANLASSALIEEVAPEAPQKPAVNLPQEQEISEVAAISLFNDGKVKEAVEIYKQLQLKFPEKSDYFAAQIDVLLS